MTRPKKINVIIPALNEAEDLSRALQSIRTKPEVEVIVVDGGSVDNTPGIAESFGTRLLRSLPGRARQMNAGAAVSNGDILLFLHADTCLPPRFAESVFQILSDPQVVAGAFRLRLDAPNWGLRIIEALANGRSKWLQMPYGDQGIFLSASLFRRLGGFRDLPIMEDFEIMQRLRREGRIRIGSASVLTSARRWINLGILKTTIMNQTTILAYYLGVKPSSIKRWYDGNRNDLLAKNLVKLESEENETED